MAYVNAEDVRDNNETTATLNAIKLPLKGHVVNVIFNAWSFHKILLFLLCKGLTSYQQLKSNGDGTSELSSERLDKPGTERTVPGLQDVYFKHYTKEVSQYI